MTNSTAIPNPTNKQNNSLYVGFDVGSTTVKAVVFDPTTSEILHSEYRRHGARQPECVSDALKTIVEIFPNSSFKCVITGSGAAPLAKAMDIPYTQEVVANSIAVRRLFPDTRTAIELGGQDAKMVFFTPDPETGIATVSDMRMNGSCAGGTGAFIDECATILRIPVEEFNARAEAGTRVYDVSGRCGVYAKTDIQPLLNQGIPKEDLALSTFHAIAKQTIGGLAQGLDVNAPVIFEGGPLTFNPQLIKVFAERLELSPEDIVVPEHPETVVALGAAMSVDDLFQGEVEALNINSAIKALEKVAHRELAEGSSNPLFNSEEEIKEFRERHKPGKIKRVQLEPGSVLPIYLGIDCGSTTTKFAVINEDDELIDQFYASNEGEPLKVAQAAMKKIHSSYREKGIELKVLGVGTTGYGEMLLHEAYKTDFHVVETVAHQTAASTVDPEVSFILDIGGQDMKAIWVDNGIVTDIIINEACSSGCGSFLENFAATLGIKTRDIADVAFTSKNPAVLGSRCTVFMNSSIVTEQRNGKTPADIMAGLCRSIVENVFTKVIRLSNLDRLGKKIMVQGGTFRNDAVLRAFEEYVGREVVRTPYPGLMGALGAAMLTHKHMEEQAVDGVIPASTFIGMDAVENLTYTQESNLTCPFCTNACNRTRVNFSNGTSFITGNRCPKGEVVGDPKDATVREQVKAANAVVDSVPNLFEERKKLLFKKYPCQTLCEERDVTIGIPRVLSFWETAPFWTTFWRALGFKVKLSPYSNRAIYENGLPAVTSDTVCFPAKLVHGHIRSLAKQGVDRIFMPIITVVESECTEATSQSMCAVVKGYPMVINNSDNPTKRWGIPFDTPLWHWYTNKDRDKQLCAWMQETFGIDASLTSKAIKFADNAQQSFHDALQLRGVQVMEEVEAEGKYAVILASRPYQNEDLVNHDLPELFAEMGIPVLTADSIPAIHTEDLSNLLLDVVNNYHARMLSTALVAAKSPHLEYAQIVNFNCGHDAYLSDEIVRVMKETGNKAPLILKVDESDIAGPLRIRVRSFIETIESRRKTGVKLEPKPLTDPFHSKFEKQHNDELTVLVPNTSHAFSMLMAAAFTGQGTYAVPMPVGREEAIRLGKKYVHNDICFPCQIVIGEALAALESGQWDPDKVAIGMAKYIGDCRLTHYTALLRKALDDAGYYQVPIITNDDVDYHNVHPGFRLNLISAIRIAYALPIVDALEELLRKIRPYELEPGSTQAAFNQALELTIDGMRHNGIKGMNKGFKQGMELMKAVKYDRSNPRPTVLIVGEYLLNFHPGANHDVEQYLEDNGMEVIEARMTDVIRKSYFYKDAQNKEYKLNKPFNEKAMMRIENSMFNLAHNNADKIASTHPLYKPPTRMQDLVKASDPIVHHTFDAGEGVLIPAEIIHQAEHGCRAFVILQPFGCLPNHVVGRGIAKKLKEMYPDAQILPLDYDPDVAPANVENRLQMLIMDAKAKHQAQQS